MKETGTSTPAMRALFRLIAKLLSLAFDGFLFIISLWFLIALIGFALLVVIALVYGLTSLR